ncbi:MAG: type II secretion system inner membrane protein GspF [Magnetococcales bacterium]|nr:type II secretion system inner membrane protein GspF [Magnetococcales bacterium]HAT49172.1 type II secretion system protein GspF [Alphaproteobacteria bacterium]
MGAFEYTALDPAGRTRKGVAMGESAREVRVSLKKQGLSLLTIQEVREKNQGKHQSVFRGGRVSQAELTLATRQLATLVRAGLPLAEALEAVSRQSSQKRMRLLMLAIRTQVLEGQSFSSALVAYPHLFSDLYRETVASGEQTGKLENVLERLADYLENSRKLKQKVGLSMIYPMVVLVFALGVTVALLTFVVPEVSKVFADFDHDLPPLTQALIALSDFLRSYGWFVAAGVVMAWIGFGMMLRNPKARYQFHRLLLVLPLVRTLVRGLDAARFARTFGILTASGVPALEGMEISARVLVNLPMKQAVAKASIKVREGGSIHMALSETNIFPPMLIHLVASGETSGNLSGMLDRAAEAQEQEVETYVATLTGLMEPLLILMMGGVVVTIVVAILLPVFELNTLIK